MSFDMKQFSNVSIVLYDSMDFANLRVLLEVVFIDVKFISINS